jgi:hypothetical protein
MVLVMLSRLKRQWCNLKTGHPGRRFQERYKRNKRMRAGKSDPRRFVTPVVGVILLALGVVFCVIPGPGLPLVLCGAMLLAERSRPIASAMDWTELKLRAVIGGLKGWWHHASRAAKNAVVVLAACLIACAGYGAYHVLSGRF